MQTKSVLSPIAAQAIFDRLSDIDRAVAEQLNVMSTANTAIAQATIRVTDLWVDRQALADELDKSAPADWMPDDNRAMAAAPSYKRFYKPAPMPLVGGSPVGGQRARPFNAEQE